MNTHAVCTSKIKSEEKKNRNKKKPIIWEQPVPAAKRPSQPMQKQCLWYLSKSGQQQTSSRGNTGDASRNTESRESMR